MTECFNKPFHASVSAASEYNGIVTLAITLHKAVLADREEIRLERYLLSLEKQTTMM